MFSSNVLAMEEMEVSVLEHDLAIQHYPATGEHLIIWIAPGFGSRERTFDMAELLAGQGVEVWHVDLADSLFLEKNTNTMRELTGAYVAGLIEQAHINTGKQITLLSRSYGAIPVLRGAREWQLQHPNPKQHYLNGAILFSPELFLTVPSLGLEAVYVPIIDATNIPIMVYQGGARGNRWQINKVVDRLQGGGAPVYLKILKGVTGLFYEPDDAPATKAALAEIPNEFVKVLNLLQKTTKPTSAKALVKTNVAVPDYPLDTRLKPFRANPTPLALDLKDITGKRIQRDNYAGKITVVNFWASWCRPCVEEIPSLNNLTRMMKGKPFELISVNYAETESRINEFLKQVNVDFPVLMDHDGSVSAAWNVLVFPSTFVIGPDGLIHYGINAAMHWDNPALVRQLDQMLSVKP